MVLNWILDVQLVAIYGNFTRRLFDLFEERKNHQAGGGAAHLMTAVAEIIRQKALSLPVSAGRGSKGVSNGKITKPGCNS